MLTFALLVNPVAGIGGSVGLKGSDGADVQAEARRRGGRGRGAERALRALTTAGPAAHRAAWVTWSGAMGADVLDRAGLPGRVLGTSPVQTSEADTTRAARAMVDAPVDLIVFCGGDGTARDLLAAVGSRVPVLGVPAGVKMHSGVFATTPEAAGEILRALIEGGLVRAAEAEVRDLDEGAIRAGEVRPRFYGEMAVPEQGGFLQHTKESGREREDLALEEIVAETLERIDERGGPFILGPGGTLAAVKSALGMEATLLGFDVWYAGRQVGTDVDGPWLERFVAETAEAPTLVLSFTRHQGFLLGRGNQQLTPAVLRRVGRGGLWVLGTRTKLLTLGGRPLQVDTDDPELDDAWSGLVEIVTGYQDSLYYRMGRE